MQLSLYQVDAFAEKVFEGNPAAVCPLDGWLPDNVMQAIAEENNLSETAFFVKGDSGIELRWLTPVEEVDFCGHATLAAAHVLFTHLQYEGQKVVFQTRSGDFIVERQNNGYIMDFPATMSEEIAAPEMLTKALGVAPQKVLAAFDYIVVLDSENVLAKLKPDFSLLAKLDLRGVVVTSKGNATDFVSRCFFPKLRINEDPVTGSAHCELAPYWQKVLEKDQLSAIQLSQRTGKIDCFMQGDRVVLKGKAVDYMKGTIHL
jgi:PhzF family phenazine biosynthesis protein